MTIKQGNMITKLAKHLFILSSLLLVSCGTASLTEEIMGTPPQITDKTLSGEMLKSLPPAKQKVVISVYQFEDQTGQHKPDDSVAQYSRAVTQGGISILNQALVDAGSRGWFTVVERNGLKNLLQERQIIRATRDQYRMPSGEKLPEIGPMLYSGVLVEGGIVSYESNIQTGGLGARYLGIGGDTQYRRDIVTIYLRAVSVENGEVLVSVSTSKTIYSIAVSAGVYKFLSFDRLLEGETGFTVNEPPQFAVRQAVEMGVYAMIMEGAIQGLWEFSDNGAGKRAMQDYMKIREDSSAETNRVKLPAEMAPIRPAITNMVPAPAAPVAPPAIATPELQVAPVPYERPQQQEMKDPNIVTPPPAPAPPAEYYQGGGQQPGSSERLYCTSGGCYPFPPPQGQ